MKIRLPSLLIAFLLVYFNLGQLEARAQSNVYSQLRAAGFTHNGAEYASYNMMYFASVNDLIVIRASGFTENETFDAAATIKDGYTCSAKHISELRRAGFSAREAVRAAAQIKDRWINLEDAVNFRRRGYSDHDSVREACWKIGCDRQSGRGC